MFLREITDLFRSQSIPFAIVDGYAVAIHGVARGTFDVDIVTEISEANFQKIEGALRGIGMKPLLPLNASELYQNLALYVSERNLIAWNFIHPTRQRDSLDIILTENLRDLEVIEVTSDLGKIPVLSIDSLIQMKSKANREQDLKDIAALRLIQQKKNS